jgi:glycine oxidase ThiO
LRNHKSLGSSDARIEAKHGLSLDFLMEKREIIILGGGLMALVTAWYLRRQGLAVTILGDRPMQAAGHAAAGMLAPQAEGLLPGPMLSLCLRSRSLYADFAAKLEQATGEPIGYWPCGIAAPEQQQSPLAHPAADRLDAQALGTIVSGLGASVTGGWWFPEDAQVDNRRLMRSLRSAIVAAGVELHESMPVQAIVAPAIGADGVSDPVSHIRTPMGDWQADHYILATGAWSQALLPSIPVVPRKGQMLSLRWREAVERPEDLPLRSVLFGAKTYIVPRQDGRIVIGATSEDVGFAPGNTAVGVNQLLQGAIALFPALAQAELVETWWGYRPATPDELPILGESPWPNLTLATGHYRNGILLAPITAALITDWVVNRMADPLLGAFRYDRFSS